MEMARHLPVVSEKSLALAQANPVFYRPRPEKWKFEPLDIPACGVNGLPTDFEIHYVYTAFWHLNTSATSLLTTPSWLCCWLDIAPAFLTYSYLNSSQPHLVPSPTPAPSLPTSKMRFSTLVTGLLTMSVLAIAVPVDENAVLDPAHGVETSGG